MTNRFEVGLEPNPANHMPLEPASFLVLTAAAFPHRLAMVHGRRSLTYAQLLESSVRLASALSRRGIGKGDVVSLMATNTTEALIAHYGVNMAGAVLNPLNVRLDAAGLAFILDHAQAKILLTDTEFAPVMSQALALAAVEPDVIDIDDPVFEGAGDPARRLGACDLDALLAEGDPAFDWPGVDDELQAICLSYTSGTTGDPKGVVSNARQIYLNSLGQLAVWALPRHPVYLWTLPMFHAIGWCMPYAMVAMAGIQVGLRKVDPAEVFRLIEEHDVTHFCAAPIVLGGLINAPAEVRPSGPLSVKVLTAGSAPPPAILAGAKAIGLDVLHVYGLTEVAGPQTYSPAQQEWDGLDDDELARLSARQGVAMATLQGGVMVGDPETCEPVAKDGRTVGEVLLRTNTIMSGYLENPTATQAAFKGGWFHSGDLAVWHSDGYVEIKDRSKDIIISGGENISSVEVEAVLYDHPAIIAAAVVAAPHEKWGETPCAFVGLRAGESLTAVEVIDWCRDRLAHFKCPTKVVFGGLPKTSTGKIQKYVLRAGLSDGQA